MADNTNTDTDTDTTLAGIQSALAAFQTGPLRQRAIELFGVLGYKSQRQLVLSPNTAAEFKRQFAGTTPFDDAKALMDQWLSADVLFQLASDDVAHGVQARLFEDGQRVDNTVIESYVFLAIHLRHGDKPYTRTQLADITRQINRIFPMPALVLFRHGQTLTFAVIDRRLNKRDENKDVLEKVTLIKDIRIADPHRAHLEILKDLSLGALSRPHDITNWVALHRAWQKTLDSSELNKRFFREIANWYFWAVKEVTFPLPSPKRGGVGVGGEKAINVIRLITRLIFVWFIKEKGLVPDDLFNPARLKTLLKNAQPLHKSSETIYYKAVLQNLFFATLNTEMGAGRKFRARSATGGRDGNFMAHSLYRYEALFADPQAALALFAGIPFLNGGLFECLDREVKAKDQEGKDEVIRVDGFSDHKDNPLKAPDYLFFGDEREVDLNADFGTANKRYKARGLIEIFKRYKFTIEENTPIEEEVALDPELLGKVFENLLAAYNPETGATARKQTGSFYTPREIVNYMVDESLIAYLSQTLPSPTGGGAGGGVSDDARLRHLLSYTTEPHRFSPDEVRALIAAIDAADILDPACGSGAFPMGVLHKLVFILGKLDPKNAQWKQRQIERVQSAMREAEKLDDATFRDQTLAALGAQIEDIELAFQNNALDYGRKLYLIENCIYGVDIQPIAVQIAKLRFFISLVVDQKNLSPGPSPERGGVQNLGIRPLPNLETKFVAANTLIGLPKPEHKAETAPGRAALPADAARLRDDLREMLRQYLKANKPETKARWLREGMQAAQELNAALAGTPGYEPVQAGWLFETARSVADLDARLPVPDVPQSMAGVAAALRNPQIEHKERELAEARHRHFDARTPATKRKWREADARLRGEIAALLHKDGWDNNVAAQLAAWDPYDQNSSAPFFDPEWMFGLSDGFDLVIGNPPYVEFKNLARSVKDSLRGYKSTKGKYDLYIPFIERSYQLMSSAGVSIFICPTRFMHRDYGEAIRGFMSQTGSVIAIVDFADLQVFDGAMNYTGIFTFSRLYRKDTSLRVMTFANNAYALKGEVVEALEKRIANSVCEVSSFSRKRLTNQPWRFDRKSGGDLLQKLRTDFRTLGEHCEGIFQGISTGKDEVFVVNRKTVIDWGIESGILKRFLKGKDIHPFGINWSGSHIIYPYSDDGVVMSERLVKSQYPNAYKYLVFHKSDLSGRGYFDSSNKLWFELWNQRRFDRFNRLKIVTLDNAHRNSFALDTRSFLGTTTTYSIMLPSSNEGNYKLLLGLLNSKLLDFFHKSNSVPQAGGYYRYQKLFIEKLPVAQVPKDKQQSIIALVDRILAAKRADPAADTHALEAEIDQLVYALYGLSEDEIRIVEGK
jgi:hypothetical protein